MSSGSSSLTESWDQSLAQRLDELTVDARLGLEATLRVIEVVRRFGFSIVDFGPCGSTAEERAARADDLLAFGSELGRPIVQSPRRELVEDVKDYASATGETDERGYRSGGEITPHSDPPTLIVLHCLQAARSGGESSLVSVSSIANRMEAADSGLADELHAPLPDWRVPGQNGVSEPGPGPARPVLARQDGVLSCVLYRPHIERAAASTGRPLTERQRAALDLFERLSMDPSLTVRFVLQPGQTLVLHNRAVLHARTDYIDWEDDARRRHLLRMWIDAPDAFPVHLDHRLGDIFGSSI